jgi:hypothetical protein
VIALIVIIAAVAGNNKSPTSSTAPGTTPTPTPTVDTSTSPPTTAPTPTPAIPVVASTPTAIPYCNFGATDAAWASCHQPDNKYSNGSAYLPFVPGAGGGSDEYTAVSHTGGRVDGWSMAFPDGTPLAAAEQELLAQLPPDTHETATFHAHSADGSMACVFVNYRSATVASWLGSNPWGDPQGAIGTAFWQTNADGSGSLSTKTVNTANVDIAPSDPSTVC